MPAAAASPRPACCCTSCTARDVSTTSANNLISPGRTPANTQPLCSRLHRPAWLHPSTGHKQLRPPHRALQAGQTASTCPQSANGTRGWNPCDGSTPVADLQRTLLLALHYRSAPPSAACANSTQTTTMHAQCTRHLQSVHPAPGALILPSMQATAPRTNSCQPTPTPHDFTDMYRNQQTCGNNKKQRHQAITLHPCTYAYSIRAE